jgi:hypothetical protein
MRTLFKIITIILATFAVANLLFAVVAGYFVAADADMVWHGVVLENLAVYATFVAAFSGLATAFTAMPGWDV